MKQRTKKVLKIDRNARTGGRPHWGPGSVAREPCDRPASSAMTGDEANLPLPCLAAVRTQTALGRHPERPPVPTKPPVSGGAVITTPVTTSPVAAQLRVSHRTQDRLGGREGDLPEPRACRVPKPGAGQMCLAPNSPPCSIRRPRGHLHPPDGGCPLRPAPRAGF